VIVRMPTARREADGAGGAFMLKADSDGAEVSTPSILRGEPTGAGGATSSSSVSWRILDARIVGTGSSDRQTPFQAGQCGNLF